MAQLRALLLRPARRAAARVGLARGPRRRDTLRRVTLIQIFARKARPLRRLVTPRQFKETYIREFIGSRRDPVYVEIGVQTGESFREVQASRKIGVDPVRHPNMAVLRDKEEFFERPSDDFFKLDAPRVLQPRSVDVALVDGLHEFRQALRDILNLEPFMKPDGLIVVDDGNPITRRRSVDTIQSGAWNGDVWKAIHFLRQERPDLEVLTVDADQGIGLVHRFGGPGRLDSLDPTVVDRYKSLDYDVLERDREKVLGLVKRAPLGRLLSPWPGPGA